MADGRQEAGDRVTRTKGLSSARRQTSARGARCRNAATSSLPCGAITAVARAAKSYRSALFVTLTASADRRSGPDVVISVCIQYRPRSLRALRTRCRVRKPGRWKTAEAAASSPPREPRNGSGRRIRSALKPTAVATAISPYDGASGRRCRRECPQVMWNFNRRSGGSAKA